MDLFWLIPLGMIVVPFLLVFFIYLSRRPLSPSDPDVLVHKPSEESPTDETAVDLDWEASPCGSYLKWLSRGRK